MEDLDERARRGETRAFYRVPSKGVTVGSKRIAQAVDDEEWQKFRHSLKGIPTKMKLQRLREYYDWQKHTHLKRDQIKNTQTMNADCDVCIRVHNYLGALARGGQLPGGSTLQVALDNTWDLEIRK